MRRITFVFDNTRSQDINEGHVLRMEFRRVRKCRHHKFKRIKKLEVYECESCNVVVSKEANKLIPSNFSLLFGLSGVTVFQDITQNTLHTIEITDEDLKKVIYVPSKIVNCENQWQKYDIDSEGNLHIKCNQGGQYEENEA